MEHIHESVDLGNFKLVLSGSGWRNNIFESLSSEEVIIISLKFLVKIQEVIRKYVYLNLPFNQTLVSSGSVFISGSGGDVTDGSGSGVFGGASPLDFTKDYQEKSSPYILSQKLVVVGQSF